MNHYPYMFLQFFTLDVIVSCACITFHKEVNIEKLLRSVHLESLATDRFVNDVPLPFEENQLETQDFHSSPNGRGFEDLSQKASTSTFSKDDPKVHTRYGLVRGLSVDKAYIFYGIPYADPPVGRRRWKPPAPVSSWSGVYDATFPKAACIQECSRHVSKECPAKMSEDCLYLNIFVPLAVNFSAPQLKPLPVMVWIHGGDFIAGSSSKPMYDGRFISNFTRTVVVSLDYRLGAFGFLVSGEDPKTSAVGNYGILDQQAALLWVQQNIAAFGGDPNKVTIFGESAGAQSVGLHLMIQSSQPLFRQAVLQSLPFSIPLKTRHEALRLGKEFARLANCSIGDITCLQSLGAQAVLQAQIKAGSEIMNPFRFLEMFETWGPNIDGLLIKEQVISAFQKGHWQKEKALLIGTTSEEGVLFIYRVFSRPVSLLECTVSVAAIFKQHALSVLYRYLPLYKDADRRAMLSQIVTDYVFLCPSRKSAREASLTPAAATWTYVFDHSPSDSRVWDGVTFCYGHVCHGAELPFLFDSGPVANFSLSPAERLLANRVLCYWGTFAHAGDPASLGAQSVFCRQQRLPPWPRYSGAGGWLLMNLTVPPHAQVGTRDDICDFWDKLGIY